MLKWEISEKSNIFPRLTTLLVSIGYDMPSPKGKRKIPEKRLTTQPSMVYNTVDDATIRTGDYGMKDRKQESLGRWISILYRYRNIFFEENLKSFGIGPAQDQIIFVLHHMIHHGRHAEVSQSDVARFLHLDKATVTRSVKKLERRGYITRRRSEHDNREYRLSLTPKAVRILETLCGIRRKWARLLEHEFTPEEKRTALNLLKRMAENAHTFLSRE